jgi:Mg/Co/Ni transporter MgtE
LEAIDIVKSSAIVTHMSVAAGDLVLRRISTEKRSPILAKLPPALKSACEIRLRYPAESAGGLMDPLAPSIPGDITVKEASKRIEGLPEGLIYHVYVLNRSRQLAGFVTLRQLVGASLRDKVESVMQMIGDVLRPDMSRAAILANPAWKTYPVLPVIDNNNVFLGAITYRALRLLEESEETRRDPGMDTGTALGELYWFGLMALYKGVEAALRNRED